MPQYLLSVHMVEGEEVPEDFDPTPMYEAVNRFNEKLQAQGHWVFAGGLHPADVATVVDGTKGGDPILTDGPFAEAKEHLGGFWVIEAADLDTAVALAAEGSAACEGPVEVRPFQDDPSAES
jgi:hypothetical protein